MSTIDGGLNPATGAYKVIIHRPQLSSTQDGAPNMPAIEVPIPSYRLGVPRFSTRGTAFLHSAVYSTSSMHEDAESIISEGLFPLPPGLDGHTEFQAQTPNPVPELHTVHVNPSNGAKRLPIPTSTPIFHTSKEPITASIYDAIAANPDNPAIVRYAIMSNREISAASPARIIAQVTSKSFLDYELLSDFFLTVRAYLSTHDLLAYLLARFEWAINRFDDDGRVIRVRAFAAIRHWVLNYFPYDFVVDRDLRVKFCEKLNDLALQVRKRTPQESSDLKLIMDLKKCWNGRCALYWDNPYAEMEGRLDIEISPGGIVGSRDSRLTHPSELWAKLAAASSHQLDQEKSVAALHNWVDSVIEAEVDGRSRNERQGSVSDPSVQAASCPIPPRTFKAFAGYQSRMNGPHPVTAPQNPVNRKASTPARANQTGDKLASPKRAEHDRSGSFSDALRDKRTSLPMGSDQNKDQIVINVPFSGGLIRGNVFPPGSPFIENVASQGSNTSSQKHAQYARMLDSAQLDPRPMSPGVRNLLANLRRAWGSKQSSNTPNAALLASAPFPPEKNAALPMHIAFKIEGLGDQYHQLEALKKNSRIDLLCADVTAVFERIMTQGPAMKHRPTSMDVASVEEDEDLSSDMQEDSKLSEREALTRNPSAVTAGSRSIVIVDDTSTEPPVPNLPAQYHEPPSAAYSLSSVQVPLSMSDPSKPPAALHYAPLIAPNSSDYRTREEDDTLRSELLPEFSMPSLAAASSTPQLSRPSDPGNAGPSKLGHKARPSAVTSKSFPSNHTDSTSLRKYASYQSGMRRSGMDSHREYSCAIDSQSEASTPQAERAPERMLRRRPGGDLRANETVHDMEPIPRPRSTGSIITYADSVRNSSKRHPEEAAQQKSFPKTQPNPQPIPNSKFAKQKGPNNGAPARKDRRPSFEAAVAEFARIPDDERGDLEATLAKLEGKFRKGANGLSGEPSSPPPTQKQGFQSQEPIDNANGQRLQVHEKELGSEESLLTPPASSQTFPRRLGGSNDDVGPRSAENEMTQSLYAASDDSYNPVPLVERGISNHSTQSAKPQSDHSQITVPQPLFSLSQKDGFDENGYPELHQDFDRISSMRRGRYRSSVPTATTDSFLLDDDESLSDLSSDLSDGEIGSMSALDEAYDSAAHHLGGHVIPPNAEYASSYLPSPPMTTENAKALKSEVSRIEEQRRPPTPDSSPVSRITDNSRGRTPGEVDGSVLQPFANKVHQFPTRRHIPFILAFDATILAQQLTIIERDALNEINWQDLIDMRWNNASSTTLNWVEYLHFSDPTGIELVTARFNLVVKWAQSEIVLTHNTEERALTLRKFIQIAAYARSIHNYATMLQLTIAMTSIDCSRLSRSWALVPESDRVVLKEMERLVSPLRNFHNLRVEMDAENLEDGCIPVVGRISRLHVSGFVVD